jgi:hypothetical protein
MGAGKGFGQHTQERQGRITGTTAGTSDGGRERSKKVVKESDLVIIEP